MRAFRHRDFRLLWLGAFFSFNGSWVQTVGQGWLVFNLTHDEAKLALVAFCNMLPVSLFGPIAGSLTDTMNKRVVLNVVQLLLAMNALFLAAAFHFGFIEYWHILAAAIFGGMVSCIEMPTRQSIVSRVVPPEDLASAIPLNAMTFNLARVIGPAIGALLLGWLGPASCYLVNGLSFFALIGAVSAIRSNLHATAREAQPIRDLVMEGAIYTFRDRRLRGLFLLEGSVSAFGLIYIPLMPAFAQKILGLDKQGQGIPYTAVGIGAFLGLLLMVLLSEKRIKALLVRVVMTVFSLSLISLAFVTDRILASLLLAVMGFCTVVQFNLTNTLFQTLSPDRLRGRVLSMHIWALSGLAPVGVIGAGWLAREASIPTAFLAGGVIVLTAAMIGWLFPGWTRGIDDRESPTPARESRAHPNAT